MLKLKTDEYLQLVIFIYKVSNDNKQARLYFYYEIRKIFNKYNVDKWYADKLLVDLNLLVYKDQYDNKYVNKKDVMITDNDFIIFNVKVHDLISNAYYQ